ncbi:MAG TPA: DinB family protein [Terriglobia bacterium]|nr:DinB family protein [Terriglobia bacterium]
MNLTDVQSLFQYNCWANSRALGAASILGPDQFSQDLGISHRSVQGTLAHILGAEWIWLMRCEGTSPKSLPPAQEFPTVNALIIRWTQLEADYGRYLERLTDSSLEKVISYTNTRGEDWAYPLRQILQHVWNHSTYHRGQVMGMLRQLGAQAAATDLLVYADQKIGAKPHP